MAPRMSKKVVVDNTHLADELVPEEPVINKAVEVPAAKKKAPKVVAAEPAEDVSSDSEVASVATDDSDKQNKQNKHRKVSIDKILAMLKKGDVQKATNALEDLVQEKKDKKPKQPSAFNLFVREKMGELKVSEPNMSTKERMGLCAKMWRERNN